MSGEMPERVERRLEDYEDIHQTFDRRISRNENWRLQMQGALKFAGFTIGASLATLSVLVALGVVHL